MALRRERRVRLSVLVGSSHIQPKWGCFLAGEMKNLAEEYKSKIQQKELDKAAFTEEQRLLRTLGPERWAEMRKLIKEQVDQFNVEMGHEAISWNDPHSYRISITRKKDGAKLEGGYEEPTKVAFFKSPKTAINLQLAQVVRQNDVVFVAINPNTKAEIMNTAYDVAYGLIRDFLSR
jgi:hypothetical protein